MDSRRLRRRLLVASYFIFSCLFSTASAVCEVKGGETVIILDVQESRGNQTEQRTYPEELPIAGEIEDIDLSIQTASYDVFRLDGKSLVLKRPLDRDAEDIASIRLQVLCQARLGRIQPFSQRAIQVLVRVNDINDNPPVFKQSQYETTVSELVPVGTTIFRDLSTMDMDTGTNGLVEYTTVRGDGSHNDGYDYFAIDLPYQGLVTVSRPLDYETSKFYYLVVKATDKATNPEERLSSTTTLTVYIEDGDDQDPSFAYDGCARVGRKCVNPEYRVDVTSGVNTGILKIHPEDIRAEDRDSLRARIRYSFVNGTPAIYHNYFAIDPDSGFVRQLQPVDRSVGKNFVMVVKAEEATTSRRFATAKLTISVQVVDSHPPVVSASAVEGFVDENSPVGTRVLSEHGKPIYFSVTDPDIAEDDPVPEYVFELTTTAFQVDNNGVLVVNEGDLDRDPPNESRYTFQVVAHQRESAPGKGSSAPLSISVNLNDVNDNSPRLPTLSPVTIQAGEGVRNVTQVQARDNDEGEFAKIMYSIYHVSNNGRDKFRIDPDTGRIEVVGKVNSGEQYSITVQATDSGARFVQGIQDVIVIPGPNTGGPVFSKESYEAQVSEGASVGSAVVTLKAQDPEGDDVSYSLTEGDENGDFVIDSLSGTVSVAKRLDREHTSSYTLQVKAEDKNSLFNVASVHISVTDINDQNPVFVQDSYNFSVEEGKKDAAVGTVQARDEDIGTNGEVYYTISGNSDFDIDAETGEISTRHALDFERQKEHVLVVTAKDRAPDARITTVSVTVNVVDVQDEKPFFERTFYEAYVPENQDNFDILTVKATDPDTNPSITYEIREGDATLFAVDPVTGVVRTLKGLDYEQRSSHTLVMGTMENKDDDVKATCTVRVAVEDRNDMAPRFTSVPLPIRLQDTVPLGTIVTTVMATDGDGSPPGNVIRYELSGQGRAPFYFLIDSTSGVITVKDDLRKEPDSEYRIEVQAHDLGDPSLAATAVVTVYVEHIATVPPDSGLGFADGFYTIELPENALANTLVKTLPIINKPRENFPVECQIVTGNEKGHFYVLDNEARDCEIRVQNQNLDYEEQNKYLLTVHLNTVGGIFGSARLTTQVAIHLLDQNDNRPVFMISPMYSQLTQNRYIAALPYDAPAGTRFLQVVAEDLDSGSNGKVMYDLSPDTDPDGKFHIEAHTGYVSNVKTFEDTEGLQLPIKLTVTARDSPDLSSRSLAQSVDVYVNLINDDNRVILAVADVFPDKALQLRDHIVSIVQQQTRLIAGVERVVALKVLRNNSIVTDSSGSDIWLHLVDPATLRILSVGDPRVQTLVSEGPQQRSFLDHLSRSLGINAQRLRSPYVITTTPPNIVHPVKISGGDSSDLGAALIVLACIIAVLGFVGIVYHCCMWSRYVANKERLKRMCIAPRYEPVYADSSLKEYETQVLQMSVPVDEGSSYRGPPYGIKNIEEVAYVSRGLVNGTSYDGGSSSPVEGPASSIGNASTARVGSCVSAFDEPLGATTKNPLYEGHDSEEEQHSREQRGQPAHKNGLTMLHPQPNGTPGRNRQQFMNGVETTTEL
ncbi:cadherin-99C-like [Ornithodoros turicata]|uniref:cadherin-99C-like n=1 Tax=Ornithodoros turicata TaxID=34597 RepID=UPI003138D5AC